MNSYTVTTDHRNAYVIFADSHEEAIEKCDQSHPDERAMVVTQTSS